MGRGTQWISLEMSRGYQSLGPLSRAGMSVGERKQGDTPDIPSQFNQQKEKLNGTTQN